MTDRVRLSKQEVTHLAHTYEAQSPQEVLQWTLARFGNRAALCTSFQADGMAILDMAWRINPHVRVFTIDTGRLPQETYTLLDQVRDLLSVALDDAHIAQPPIGDPTARHHRRVERNGNQARWSGRNIA